MFNAMKILPYYQIQIKFTSLEDLQSSQNIENQPQGNKWDVEDIVLISALCIDNTYTMKIKLVTKKGHNLGIVWCSSFIENIGNVNEYLMRGCY